MAHMPILLGRGGNSSAPFLPVGGMDAGTDGWGRWDSGKASPLLILWVWDLWEDWVEGGGEESSRRRHWNLPTGEGSGAWPTYLWNQAVFM